MSEGSGPGRPRVLTVFGESRMSAQGLVRLYFERDGHVLGQIDSKCSPADLKLLSDGVPRQLRDALRPSGANEIADPNRFGQELIRLGNGIAHQAFAKEDRKQLFAWLANVDVLAIVGEIVEPFPWEILFDAPDCGFLCERVFVVRLSECRPRRIQASGTTPDRVVLIGRPRMLVDADGAQAMEKLSEPARMPLNSMDVTVVGQPDGDLRLLEGPGDVGRLFFLVVHGEKAGTGLHLTRELVITARDLALFKVIPKSFIVACFCEWHDGGIPRAMVEHWDAAVFASISVLPTGEGISLAASWLDAVSDGQAAAGGTHLVDVYRRFLRRASPFGKLFRLYGVWDVELVKE